MSLELKGFEFDRFFLETEEKILLRDGHPVPITPKTFQLLHLLVANHGHIVEKEEIMQKVWNDSFVEDSNLTFSISQLRKILEDNKQKPRFIETIARRGYRFIAEVRENQKDEKPNKSPGFKAKSFFPSWVSGPLVLSIFGVLALFFLLIAGFFVWRTSEYRDREIANSILKFERVTGANRPVFATISPDGKYIVYTNIANGQMSIWLKQLSSGINMQIVAPTPDITFPSMQFSGNGEYIYFAYRHREEPVRLNRVSILGGAVKTNIVSNLDGAFDISPDDRRISFRRYTPQKRSLLIADIDGSNEREIFTTSKTFTDNVFSPDGKTIAFASGQSDTGDQDFGVYTIAVEGGQAKPATDFKWFHVRGIVWLPDQSGLLVTAMGKSGDLTQLWQISLSNGEVKKITDTQNGFTSISATKDLSQILLTQVSLSSNLYRAPASLPDNVQPLTQAYGGVVWTPEGNLVYSSSSSGNNDIWVLNPETINQKQLTTEGSMEITPKVAPDGRYLVFISNRAGKNNVWRINADGGNPVQLTNGTGEQSPVFTPDGRFVVFNSMKDLSLWKVSIEGGQPIPISDEPAYQVSISPDGAKFAHFTQKGGTTKISVKSFSNCEVLQELALPNGNYATRDIVWAKDGNALTYALEENNSVGNLWQQSLNGTAPNKLTNYSSEEVFYFDFSPDGSQLAIIRGSWNHDIVLLKGFHSEP
jgi:Tol biopolymer transport system component/DNA-binding winged helix-turn-helix (wHTH) protein